MTTQERVTQRMSCGHRQTFEVPADATPEFYDELHRARLCSGCRTVISDEAVEAESEVIKHHDNRLTVFLPNEAGVEVYGGNGHGSTRCTAHETGQGACPHVRAAWAYFRANYTHQLVGSVESDTGEYTRVGNCGTQGNNAYFTRTPDRVTCEDCKDADAVKGHQLLYTAERLGYGVKYERAR